ncbi:MAG: SMP-30/gluconolactonase/LRE family protein [Acidobacteria bacterium]|nr:SMP-30/gluconolactonase/LRE family protein [Acidobacteriota bacterium]
MKTALLSLAVLLTLPGALHAAVVSAPPDPPHGPLLAIADLRTNEGAALVSARWRYRDAVLTPVDGRGPGPDLRATGPTVKTVDLLPRPGRDFDGAGWQDLPASSLEVRRGNGQISFGWYRVSLTLPAELAGVPLTGKAIAFEIVVDDYAEIWVNGELPVALGQSGGPLPKGFNAPGRVLLTKSAVPGTKYDLAVLAANGPLSKSPQNFLWVRSATLDVHGPEAEPPAAGRVERLDPALDAIVPKDARIEKVAEGFRFTEGPVWVADASQPDGGYLLFSDPNANTIYRYEPAGRVSVFRTKSGYTGADLGAYGQPGSNGLALDREGRLTIAEHGNRRVTRLEKTGAVSVLASAFEGKRLNSPNDLVYRSDGTLYFTDPPFGLPKFHEDPRRELPFTGVFSLKDGVLRAVARDFTGPNGLAFSPDEKFLYVANWDEKKKVVFRYEARPDGTLGTPEPFFDAGSLPGAEALDGLKVDERGNVYVSAPGGVQILSASGRRLGVLAVSELPANFAWGDADGRTLYLTARTGLYRIRLSVSGAGKKEVRP